MSYSLPHKFIIWIDDEKQLEAIVNRWKRHTWLCLDTEFIRCSTFYPKPALIQVFDGKNITLIDPLKITDWAPLAEILTEPGIIKIMHAPQEDIEALNILTARTVSPLIDIQLAAAFCNLPYPCGYKMLAKQLLNVDVSKESTRSDWLQRPLTDEQIMYAASDVYYLPQLYKVLYEKIKQDNAEKLQWLTEESGVIAQSVMQKNDPANFLQGLTPDPNLSAEQNKIMRMLHMWREFYIRKHDIPRKRVLSIELFTEIARHSPTDIRQMQDIPGFSASLIRKYGKHIIKTVQKAQQLSGHDDSEKQDTYLKLPVEIKPISEEIQQECKQLCQQCNINSILLPGKKYAFHIMQQWMKSGEFLLPDTVMQSWKKVLLQPLLDRLTHKYRHLKNSVLQSDIKQYEE